MNKKELLELFDAKRDEFIAALTPDSICAYWRTPDTAQDLLNCVICTIFASPQKSQRVFWVFKCDDVEKLDEEIERLEEEIDWGGKTPYGDPMPEKYADDYCRIVKKILKMFKEL